MWVEVGWGSAVISNRRVRTAVNIWKTTESCILQGQVMCHVSCEFFNEAVIKPKRTKLENSPFQASTLREASFTILWRLWFANGISIFQQSSAHSARRLFSRPILPPQAPCCWLLPVPSLGNPICCPWPPCSCPRCPSLRFSLLRKASSKCQGCLRNLVTRACCGVFGRRGLCCQRCQAQRVTKPSTLRFQCRSRSRGELRPFSCLGRDILIFVQLCMLYSGEPYTRLCPVSIFSHLL